MLTQWLKRRQDRIQAKTEAIRTKLEKDKKELEEKLEMQSTKLKSVLIKAGFVPFEWCCRNVSDEYVESHFHFSGKIFKAKMYSKGGLWVEQIGGSEYSRISQEVGL